MIMIGDRKQFAIGYEVDANAEKRWINGKCCYWIAGEMVGNYDSGVALNDVMMCMNTIARDNGKRSSETLCNLSAQNLHGLLTGLLYAEDAPEHDDHDIEMPARFDVRPWVPIFDGFYIYAVQCGSDVRVVYGEASHAIAKEHRLPIAEFEPIFPQFFHALDKIYIELGA